MIPKVPADAGYVHRPQHQQQPPPSPPPPQLQQEAQHQAPLVLQVVLGGDPSRVSSSGVLRPFHTVCSEGHAAALRTIRHLHLERCVGRGVTYERQLFVLSAADQATSLTISSSQIEGLVACLTPPSPPPQQQQQEQEQHLQQEEKEQQQQLRQEDEEGHMGEGLSQEGTLQLSLGGGALAPDTNTTTDTNTFRSSCVHGSSNHINPTLTLLTSAATNSISAADAAPSHPTMPAAKPRGPYLAQLTVVGPVTEATALQVEQLLDLLPGTQHLQQVVLKDELSTLAAEWRVPPGQVEPIRMSGEQVGGVCNAYQPQSLISSSGRSSSSSWRSSCHTLAVSMSWSDPLDVDVSHLRPLLGPLHQLRTLYLEGVFLEGLAQYAASLRQLQWLDMVEAGSCGPEELDCVAGLTNLRNLSLFSYSTITSPAAFSRLVHLSSLDVKGSVLTQQALEGVCGVTGLRHLVLTGTRGFAALPPSISRLVNLEILMLSDSGVGSLPECLTALTALHRLNWSQGAATAPLPLGVVWRLKSLRILILEDDHLTAVPEAISQLTGLHQLHVQGRALAALPTSMSTLVQLAHLLLPAPQLRALPEGITAFTRLASVYAPDMWLQDQSPAVQAFLAARQAQGCVLELAPADSSSE